MVRHFLRGFPKDKSGFVFNMTFDDSFFTDRILRRHNFEYQPGHRKNELRDVHRSLGLQNFLGEGNGKQAFPHFSPNYGPFVGISVGSAL